VPVNKAIPLDKEKKQTIQLSLIKNANRLIMHHYQN